VWDQLADDISYIPGEFEDPATYRRLGEVLERLGAASPTVFYLATPPSTFGTIVAGLGQAGLVRNPSDPATTRIVVEKPFGRDRASAQALNTALHAVFDESQIFRIDHYLGKETVQNLLVFRLENGIFESLWNRRHVDHVQITVAETDGVGTRAGFYEEAGALRDIVQNHMLQLVSLVAMEAPVRFDARSVRNEKVKVLESMRPFSPERVRLEVVRGRYEAGLVEGNPARGYLEEDGVATDSRTDTFVAARLHLDSWRWGGTPFYVRTGKRLPKRVTEIAIVFLVPPCRLFPSVAVSEPRANVLRFRIQPEEGISLSFESKVPGRSLTTEQVRMDMSYATSFGRESPEAYERLLLDVVQGDSTLFAREDEVDLSWRLIDAIANAWGEDDALPLHGYPAGSWGPAAADRLITSDGREWLRP
jgi:glucose-6-phosphate 1-dehydrogenase